MAADVATVLAQVHDHSSHGAPLLLRLALSVCMLRHGADPEDLVAAMRLLRRTVLSLSGLPVAAEPVPLVPGDPVGASLRWGSYICDLLHRAGQATDTAPVEVAATAAAQLGAA